MLPWQCDSCTWHTTWGRSLRRRGQDTTQATRDKGNYLASRKWISSVHAQSLQSSLSLCNPMDCSSPDSSVHGILQARIQEWVSMPSSRRSSRPRDQTCISCTESRFYTHWAIREALNQLWLKLNDDWAEMNFHVSKSCCHEPRFLGALKSDLCPWAAYLCQVELVVLSLEAFSFVIVAGGHDHIHGHHAQDEHVEDGWPHHLLRRQNGRTLNKGTNPWFNIPMCSDFAGSATSLLNATVNSLSF